MYTWQRDHPIFKHNVVKKKEEREQRKGTKQFENKRSTATSHESVDRRASLPYRSLILVLLHCKHVLRRFAGLDEHTNMHFTRRPSPTGGTYLNLPAFFWGIGRIDTRNLDTPRTRRLSFARYDEMVIKQRLWGANSVGRYSGNSTCHSTYNHVQYCTHIFDIFRRDASSICRRFEI